MDIKNNVLKVSIYILLTSQVFVTHGAAKEEIASNIIVQFEEGKLLLQTQEAALREILDGILHECMVKISGLEHREAEPITFSSKREPIEEAIKHLLRHLGETNYAFEFVHENLRRVSIFPRGKDTAYLPKLVPEEDARQKNFIDAVKVTGIVKDSQADSLALREGDLIIEYDGLKITNGPQELVAEVRKKASKESVDMVVIRDGAPLSISLKGALIGVRIDPIKISQEEYQ
ncbi:MAG TPA: PDZ domain-containing protein [Desulfatiglandales bacterium]|nr:PDZ domain-containing protein [Desulfatiglandales bacterium]